MITYAFILMLPFWADIKCPEPKKEIIEDDQGLTWTEEDDKVLVQAAAGCRKYYGENSCLVRLTKTGEQAYNAVCRKYADSN